MNTYIKAKASHNLSKVAKHLLYLALGFTLVGLMIPQVKAASSVSVVESVPLVIQELPPDITREEQTKALLDYHTAVKEKEAEAHALEVFSKPPMLESSIEAGSLVPSAVDTVFDTANQETASSISAALFPDDKTAAELESEYYEHLESQGIDPDDLDVAGEPRQIMPYLVEHLSLYCSDREKEVLKGCEDSSAPGGDTAINSLIGSTSFDLNSPAQQKAAKAIIHSLTDAYAIPVANVQRDDSGDVIPIDFSQMDYQSQELVVRKYMGRATSSIALNSLYHMYAMRIPTADLDNKSPMQLIEEESLRRFNNPDWITALAVTPKEGILRELAQIEAFKVYMDYLRYRQAERIEVLLTGFLTSTSNFQLQLLSGIADAQAIATGKTPEAPSDVSITVE